MESQPQQPNNNEQTTLILSSSTDDHDHNALAAETSQISPQESTGIVQQQTVEDAQQLHEHPPEEAFPLPEAEPAAEPFPVQNLPVAPEAMSQSLENSSDDALVAHNDQVPAEPESTPAIPQDSIDQQAHVQPASSSPLTLTLSHENSAANIVTSETIDQSQSKDALLSQTPFTAPLSHSSSRASMSSFSSAGAPSPLVLQPLLREAYTPHAKDPVPRFQSTRSMHAHTARPALSEVARQARQRNVAREARAALSRTNSERSGALPILLQTERAQASRSYAAKPTVPRSTQHQFPQLRSPYSSGLPSPANKKPQQNSWEEEGDTTASTSASQPPLNKRASMKLLAGDARRLPPSVVALQMAARHDAQKHAGASAENGGGRAMKRTMGDASHTSSASSFVYPPLHHSPSTSLYDELVVKAHHRIHSNPAYKKAMPYPPLPALAYSPYQSPRNVRKLRASNSSSQASLWSNTTSAVNSPRNQKRTLNATEGQDQQQQWQDLNEHTAISPKSSQKKLSFAQHEADKNDDEASAQSLAANLFQSHFTPYSASQSVMARTQSATASTYLQTVSNNPDILVSNQPLSESGRKAVYASHNSSDDRAAHHVDFRQAYASRRPEDKSIDYSATLEREARSKLDRNYSTIIKTDEMGNHTTWFNNPQVTAWTIIRHAPPEYLYHRSRVLMHNSPENKRLSVQVEKEARKLTEFIWEMNQFLDEERAEKEKLMARRYKGFDVDREIYEREQKRLEEERAFLEEDEDTFNDEATPDDHAPVMVDGSDAEQKETGEEVHHNHQRNLSSHSKSSASFSGSLGGGDMSHTASASTLTSAQWQEWERSNAYELERNQASLKKLEKDAKDAAAAGHDQDLAYADIKRTASVKRFKQPPQQRKQSTGKLNRIHPYASSLMPSASKRHLLGVSESTKKLMTKPQKEISDDQHALVDQIHAKYEEMCWYFFQIRQGEYIPKDADKKNATAPVDPLLVDSIRTFVKQSWGASSPELSNLSSDQVVQLMTRAATGLKYTLPRLQELRMIRKEESVDQGTPSEDTADVDEKESIAEPIKDLDSLTHAVRALHLQIERAQLDSFDSQLGAMITPLTDEELHRFFKVGPQADVRMFHYLWKLRQQALERAQRKRMPPKFVNVQHEDASVRNRKSANVVSQPQAHYVRELLKETKEDQLKLQAAREVGEAPDIENDEDKSASPERVKILSMKSRKDIVGYAGLNRFLSEDEPNHKQGNNPKTTKKKHSEDDWRSLEKFQQVLEKRRQEKQEEEQRHAAEKTAARKVTLQEQAQGAHLNDLYEYLLQWQSHGLISVQEVPVVRPEEPTVISPSSTLKPRPKSNMRVSASAAAVVETNPQIISPSEQASHTSSQVNISSSATLPELSQAPHARGGGGGTDSTAVLPIAESQVGDNGDFDDEPDHTFITSVSLPSPQAASRMTEVAFTITMDQVKELYDLLPVEGMVLKFLQHVSHILHTDPSSLPQGSAPPCDSFEALRKFVNDSLVSNEELNNALDQAMNLLNAPESVLSIGNDSQQQQSEGEEKSKRPPPTRLFVSYSDLLQLCSTFDITLTPASVNEFVTDLKSVAGTGVKFHSLEHLTDALYRDRALNPQAIAEFLNSADCKVLDPAAQHQHLRWNKASVRALFHGKGKHIGGSNTLSFLQQLHTAEPLVKDVEYVYDAPTEMLSIKNHAALKPLFQRLEALAVERIEAEQLISNLLTPLLVSLRLPLTDLADWISTMLSWFDSDPSSPFYQHSIPPARLVWYLSNLLSIPQAQAIYSTPAQLLEAVTAVHQSSVRELQVVYQLLHAQELDENFCLFAAITHTPPSPTLAQAQLSSEEKGESSSAEASPNGEKKSEITKNSLLEEARATSSPAVPSSALPTAVTTGCVFPPFSFEEFHNLLNAQVTVSNPRLLDALNPHSIQQLLDVAHNKPRETKSKPVTITENNGSATTSPPAPSSVPAPTRFTSLQHLFSTLSLSDTMSRALTYLDSFKPKEKSPLAPGARRRKKKKTTSTASAAGAAGANNTAAGSGAAGAANAKKKIAAAETEYKFQLSYDSRVQYVQADRIPVLLLNPPAPPSPSSKPTRHHHRGSSTSSLSSIAAAVVASSTAENGEESKKDHRATTVDATLSNKPGSPPPTSTAAVATSFSYPTATPAQDAAAIAAARVHKFEAQLLELNQTTGKVHERLSKLQVVDTFLTNALAGMNSHQPSKSTSVTPVQHYCAKVLRALLLPPGGVEEQEAMDAAGLPDSSDEESDSEKDVKQTSAASPMNAAAGANAAAVPLPPILQRKRALKALHQSIPFQLSMIDRIYEFVTAQQKVMFDFFAKDAHASACRVLFHPSVWTVAARPSLVRKLILSALEGGVELALDLLTNVRLWLTNRTPSIQKVSYELFSSAGTCDRRARSLEDFVAFLTQTADAASLYEEDAIDFLLGGIAGPEVATMMDIADTIKYPLLPSALLGSTPTNKDAIEKVTQIVKQQLCSLKLFPAHTHSFKLLPLILASLQRAHMTRVLEGVLEETASLLASNNHVYIDTMSATDFNSFIHQIEPAYTNVQALVDAVRSEYEKEEIRNFLNNTVKQEKSSSGCGADSDSQLLKCTLFEQNDASSAPIFTRTQVSKLYKSIALELSSSALRSADGFIVPSPPLAFIYFLLRQLNDLDAKVQDLEELQALVVDFMKRIQRSGMEIKQWLDSQTGSYEEDGGDGDVVMHPFRFSWVRTALTAWKQNLEAQDAHPSVEGVAQEEVRLLMMAIYDLMRDSGAGSALSLYMIPIFDDYSFEDLARFDARLFVSAFKLTHQRLVQDQAATTKWLNANPEFARALWPIIEKSSSDASTESSVEPNETRSAGDIVSKFQVQQLYHYAGYVDHYPLQEHLKFILHHSLYSPYLMGSRSVTASLSTEHVFQKPVCTSLSSLGHLVRSYHESLQMLLAPMAEFLFDLFLHHPQVFQHSEDKNADSFTQADVDDIQTIAFQVCLLLTSPLVHSGTDQVKNALRSIPDAMYLLQEKIVSKFEEPQLPTPNTEAEGNSEQKKTKLEPMTEFKQLLPLALQVFDREILTRYLKNEFPSGLPRISTDSMTPSKPPSSQPSSAANPSPKVARTASAKSENASAFTLEDVDRLVAESGFASEPRPAFQLMRALQTMLVQHQASANANQPSPPPRLATLLNREKQERVRITQAKSSLLHLMLGSDSKNAPDSWMVALPPFPECVEQLATFVHEQQHPKRSPQPSPQSPVRNLDTFLSIPMGLLLPAADESEESTSNAYSPQFLHHLDVFLDQLSTVDIPGRQPSAFLSAQILTLATAMLSRAYFQGDLDSFSTWEKMQSKITREVQEIARKKDEIAHWILERSGTTTKKKSKKRSDGDEEAKEDLNALVFIPAKESDVNNNNNNMNNNKARSGVALSNSNSSASLASSVNSYTTATSSATIPPSGPRNSFHWTPALISELLLHCGSVLTSPSALESFRYHLHCFLLEGRHWSSVQDLAGTVTKLMLLEQLLENLNSSALMKTLLTEAQQQDQHGNEASEETMVRTRLSLADVESLVTRLHQLLHIHLFQLELSSQRRREVQKLLQQVVANATAGAVHEMLEQQAHEERMRQPVNGVEDIHRILRSMDPIYAEPPPEAIPRPEVTLPSLDQFPLSPMEKREQSYAQHLIRVERVFASLTGGASLLLSRLLVLERSFGSQSKKKAFSSWDEFDEALIDVELAEEVSEKKSKKQVPHGAFPFQSVKLIEAPPAPPAVALEPQEDEKGDNAEDSNNAATDVEETKEDEPQYGGNEEKQESESTFSPSSDSDRDAAHLAASIQLPLSPSGSVPDLHHNSETHTISTDGDNSAQ